MFDKTLSRTVVAWTMAALCLVPLWTPRSARAQTVPPPVVRACSGVNLPRSVVTDILRPVITGVVSPIETTVNSILGVVRIIPVVGTVLPRLNVNATDLLDDAEEGDDITLSVLDSDGEIVGPGDACNSQADAFSLSTPAGLSIGGNRITGLGAAGAQAAAGEINSIAFGNSAATDRLAGGAVAIGFQASLTGAATGSVALGAGASASVGNSLALGAGSIAGRGALTGYAATGLTGLQTSAGEVSFGAPGATRQLTHVAAGSAATDAVNLGQLQGMRTELTTLVGGSTTAITNLTTSITQGAIGPVRYSTALTPTVPNTGAISSDLTLVGLGGAVKLHNIAPGAVGVGSTDAVNGGQMFGLASRIAAGFGGASVYDPSTNLLTVGLTYQGVNYASLQDVLTSLGAAPSGGVPSPFLAVLSSGAAASATGAESVAVGPGAAAAAANSVALGAGSIASRGGLASYAALGLATPQTAVGEVSIGTTGAERQLTHVAAGSASSDAVNVGQLQGVASQVTALADTSVRYTDVVAGRIVLAGTTGATISNLRAGALTAGSTEAVNGGQISTLANRLAAGFGGTSSYDPTANMLTLGLTYQGAAYASLQDVLNVLTAPAGGGASPFLSVFSTGAAALAAGAESAAIGPGATAGAANSVALGAGSTALRGSQTGYAALGLSIPQSSVGEVSIGAAGGERQLTHVAAGTALTDAVNLGQLQGVSTQLTALADTSVRYTDVVAGRIVLAGTSGTTISNLGAGAVTLTSTEAINGAQLFDTNTRLAATAAAVTINTTRIDDLRTALTLLGTPVAGGGSPYLSVSPTGGAASASADDTVALGQDAVASFANSVALGAGSAASRGSQVGYTALGLAQTQTSAGEVSIGAVGSERQLTHVAAGTAATDAVNVGQLQGVSDRVTALTRTSVGYDDASRATLTLAGAGGTTIANVAAGQVTATSTDAINGAQLFATHQAVTANTTAITTLSAATNALANGATGPVQYSNAATPTVGNGGVRTDNLTLVGASGGPIILSNVAAGRIAAGSTDAVNGGQIHELARNAANVVAYDVDAGGSRTGTVTLSGAEPVLIGNLGAGVVAATSTMAVNGSQLYATNQAVTATRATADAAMTMGLNSVQYSDADRTTIRLGGLSGGPVRMSNLADGVAPTDAVTVQQLNDGMRRAVSDAATYTDMRIALANFQIGRVRDELNAGTAGALAAAGLPQIAEPGRGMMAVGFGGYEGQSAIAVGFSRATSSGGAVIRAGATYDSAGRLGVNGGVGWRF